MEPIELFRERRSVRSYTDEEVPDEVISEMLHVGNLAPSAGNLHARDFVVVKDAETRRRLAQAALGQRSLEVAPITVVCCANLDRIAHYGARGRELYCIQDVAAAVENMLLYIAARGYGSCWIGAFDESRVADLLSLPTHVRPLVLLPVGRPKKEEGRRPQMRIDELMHRERW